MDQHLQLDIVRWVSFRVENQDQDQNQNQPGPIQLCYPDPNPDADLADLSMRASDRHLGVRVLDKLLTTLQNKDNERLEE